MKLFFDCHAPLLRSWLGARRGQHHLFQIVYMLQVLIDLYTCKGTRSILY